MNGFPFASMEHTSIYSPYLKWHFIPMAHFWLSHMILSIFYIHNLIICNPVHPLRWLNRCQSHTDTAAQISNRCFLQMDINILWCWFGYSIHHITGVCTSLTHKHVLLVSSIRGHLCPKCLYIISRKDKKLSTQKCHAKAFDNAELKTSTPWPNPREAELHCWGIAILMQDFSLPVKWRTKSGLDNCNRQRSEFPVKGRKNKSKSVAQKIKIQSFRSLNA